MSRNWNNSASDIGGNGCVGGGAGGGILRKPSGGHQKSLPESRVEDLLVFGYACKIFRDDQKALYIDQGKQLIPWMGDNTFKIDRYDVRAALPDLSQYEPPIGGYINRLDYLTAEEQRAEQLCEEERYYSLYHNEEEELTYQEEELKRLHQERSSTYGQVSFDYNNQPTQNLEAPDDKFTESDEVYKPPENLQIPETLELPEKMKTHAIIEKTAKFISIQGPQMEILIKAKQSNSPQFDFLNQNNRLYPYYKFILNAFKNGNYPTDEENTSEDKEFTNEATGEYTGYQIDGSAYSLMQIDNSSFAYPTIPVPKIKYKPSANCAYTQLISKIKGVPLPELHPVVEISDNVQTIQPQPIVSDLTVDYNNYAFKQDTNSHLCLQYTGTKQTVDNIVINNGMNTHETSVNPTQMHDKSEPQQPAVHNLLTNKPNSDGVELKKISVGLMLAQCYASDTEDESEDADKSNSTIEQILDFPIPPDHLQHIIDKTAAYVLKNGKEFEDILRTKLDPRFEFLNSSNEFNRYYLYKVTNDINAKSENNGELMVPVELSKGTNVVSFSIKPKQEIPVPKKPALPQETSDDEMDSTSETVESNNQHSTILDNVGLSNYNQLQTPESVPVQITNQLADNQSILLTKVPPSSSLLGHKESNNFTDTVNAISLINLPITPPNGNVISSKSRFDIDNTGAKTNKLSAVLPAPISLIIANDITAQQKEVRRAEEKVKDRLAQAARENLGFISKEKQLQLERKKRARAFLDQIKGTSVPRQNIAQTNSVTEPKESGESESDTSSVHSIPMESVPKEYIPTPDVIVVETPSIPDVRSKSKLRLTTTIHKQKKSKHSSKRKSAKKSRGRSKSRSDLCSRSRSRSQLRLSTSRSGSICRKVSRSRSRSCSQKEISSRSSSHRERSHSRRRNERCGHTKSYRRSRSREKRSSSHKSKKHRRDRP